MTFKMTSMTSKFRLFCQKERKAGDSSSTPHKTYLVLLVSLINRKQSDCGSNKYENLFQNFH